MASTSPHSLGTRVVSAAVASAVIGASELGMVDAVDSELASLIDVTGCASGGGGESDATKAGGGREPATKRSCGTSSTAVQSCMPIRQTSDSSDSLPVRK